MSNHNLLDTPVAQQTLGLVDDHLVPVAQSTKAIAQSMINVDAAEDFLALQEAAMTAGFDLQIASGFRSFERQLHIWNSKFEGRLPIYDLEGSLVSVSNMTEQQRVFAILNFSALPGLSRHHWGSDFDYYDPTALGNEKLQLNENEYTNNGVFSALNIWLDDALPQFGFFKPYRAYNNEIKGTAAEPWHLSHIKTSSTYLHFLRHHAKQVLLPTLQQHNIRGFDSIERHFDDILHRFALSICRP